MAVELRCAIIVNRAADSDAWSFAMKRSEPARRVGLPVACMINAVGDEHLEKIQTADAIQTTDIDGTKILGKRQIELMSLSVGSKPAVSRKTWGVGGNRNFGLAILRRSKILDKMLR